ncbi:MAG: hypothetical protein V1874_09305 [Spirochaetota bacterium]
MAHPPSGEYTWYEGCCLIMIMPFQKLSEYINKNRTETIEINGVKFKIYENTIGRYYDIKGKPFKDGKLAGDASIPVGGVNIKFQNNTGIEFYPDGALLSGTPLKEIETGIFNKRIRFFPTRTFFNKNGSIKKGFLTDKIDLPAGKEMILFSNDYISFYPNGLVLAGRPVSYELKTKSGTLIFNKNTLLVFKENGSIEYAFNIKPHCIRQDEKDNLRDISDYCSDNNFIGIRYKKSDAEIFLSAVSLYPDGQIHHINLTYGTMLMLNINGRPYSFTSSNQHIEIYSDNIDKNKLESIWKHSVSFFPDGFIESGYLANTQKINIDRREVAFTGLDKRAYTDSLKFKVYFHKDGTLMQGSLEHNQSLSTSEGYLKFCGVKENENDQGRSIVIFHKNGKVKSGTVIKKFIREGDHYINPNERSRLYTGDGYYYELYTDN